VHVVQFDATPGQGVFNKNNTNNKQQQQQKRQQQQLVQQSEQMFYMLSSFLFTLQIKIQHMLFN